MRSAFVLVLTIASASVVWGQKAGGPPATGAAPTTGGAPSTGTPGLGSPSTSGIPPNSSNNGGQGQPAPERPIFISGKVMMEDGSPLPSNVKIQRTCGTSQRSVAYADNRGNFSFQWNEPAPGIADASESGFGGRALGAPAGMSSGIGSGMGSNNVASGFESRGASCDLRALLAGFRSTVVNLVALNPMEMPDVGVLILHRLAPTDGSTVSATALQAPKDARKAYEKGLQLLSKNKTEDASREFEKAVLSYPKYADAWMSLGQTRLRLNALEPAHEAMLKAVECDPKLVGPYIELGMMAARQARWEEAGQYLDKGLKLDPVDFPQAWFADAVANFNLQKYDVADKSIREAVKRDPKHTNPQIGFLFGLVLTQKRDYTAAADQFRDYLRYAPAAADTARAKEQLGQLEKVMAQSGDPSK